MRQRRGWTQEQVAAQLGVVRNAVARWEQGERLPSSEQIQAICYALGAQEEELIALMTGRFTATPTEPLTNPIAAGSDLHGCLLHLHYRRHDTQRDLNYLILERETWLLAARAETQIPLLAQMYAYHAEYLRDSRRWAESSSAARRAIDLLPRQEKEDPIAVRAALNAAAAYGGSRPAPWRGLTLLKSWLPRAADPALIAWILSDMAEYAMQDGNVDESLALARQSCQSLEAYHAPVELDLRRYHFARRLLEAGRPAAALDTAPEPTGHEPHNHVRVMLTLTRAHLQTGNRSAAQDWLQQALNLIGEHSLSDLRPQADELASLW